jgi:hypothetical protein
MRFRILTLLRLLVWGLTGRPGIVPGISAYGGNKHLDYDTVVDGSEFGNNGYRGMLKTLMRNV